MGLACCARRRARRALSPKPGLSQRTNTSPSAVVWRTWGVVSVVTCGRSPTSPMSRPSSVRASVVFPAFVCEISDSAISAVSPTARPLDCPLELRRRVDRVRRVERGEDAGYALRGAQRAPARAALVEACGRVPPAGSDCALVDERHQRAVPRSLPGQRGEERAVRLALGGRGRVEE